MQIGAMKRALMNDRYCGDNYGHWEWDGSVLLCMADGLGHGKDAELAANAALEYVAEHLAEPLPDILRGCDANIRHTRGVAMGLARIMERDGEVHFAGIGNTRARVVDAQLGVSRVLNSAHGIVGGGARSVVPETRRIAPGDLVIMYTDGVKEMIDLSSYEAELFSQVQNLSERILADWGRKTDDAAVLVFKKEA